MTVNLKSILCAMAIFSLSNQAFGCEGRCLNLDDDKPTSSVKKIRTADSIVPRPMGKASLKTTLVQGIIPHNVELPFFVSIRNGKVKEVESFIANDPNVVSLDDHGLSALTIAVFYGHVSIVEFLLEKNAPINDLSWGETPLMTAAFMGNEAMVRLLKDRGADLKIRYPYGGYTAYDMALAEGHKSVARTLGFMTSSKFN